MYSRINTGGNSNWGGSQSRGSVNIHIHADEPRIRTQDLEQIPSGHCKGLKSREELEKRILELLKDDMVKAIGIWGMGGAGKTTLAKEVKNKGAKDMFDLISMVEVSQDPNIERIQDHIAGSIGLSLDSKLPRELRATLLYNALKQVKRTGLDNDHRTKILIVIDNIWQKLKLKDVGIPHERTSQFSCKVVFTSRMKQVCKSMGVPDENIVHVGLLTEDESRYLFWERAGNFVDQKVPKSLGERLLKGCGRLPLAITALAKALSGQHLSVWQDYAEELEKPISCRSEDVYDEGIYKVLEASYKSIGKNDVKTFFLLACLYPFGLKIPIEDLMRYGIGLGLFRHVDSLIQAIRQARRWAKDLISSSLLLESDDNEDYFTWQSKGFTEPDYRVQADFVKIHDVVRSYAILYAEKDGHRMMVEAIPQWQSDESGQEYTAISLTNDRGHSRLKEMKLDVLETLLLKVNRNLQLDDDIFQGMASLKVLQLSPMWCHFRLPKSITGLSRLRVLHLEKCEFEDVDIELIGELVGLLVLSLRRSNVKMLPHGMKKLSNLRLLDLTCCDELKTIPANVMGSLTQLEGLYMLGGYTSWQRSNSEVDEANDEAISVSELISLRHLKVLEINVEGIEQLPTDTQFANNLDELKILVGHTRWVVEAQLWGAFNMKLESWECVWRYPCLKGLLPRSDRLKLRSFNRDDEKIKGLKNVVPYLGVDGFRNVEDLHLESLGGLTRLCEGEVVPPGMFYNLRRLSLWSLDNIGPYVLPVNVAPKLTTLSVKSCCRLRFIWMEIEDATSTSSVQREIPVNAIHTFPCLKELKLESLPLQTMLAKAQASTSTDMTIPEALLNPKIIFPSLEKLEVNSIECVKLWETPEPMGEMHTIQYFSQLKSLRRIDISRAKNLEALGSPSIAAALVQLEELQVRYCPKMKEIISEEEKETEISSRIIRFSKLKCLYLYGLEELRWLYGGAYKLEFPALKELTLGQVTKISSFVEPKNSTACFAQKVVLPSLEKLDVIESNGTFVELWDIPESTEMSQFQNLRTMFIGFNQELRDLRLRPSVIAAFVQLESLAIEDCPNMKEVVRKETNEAEISSKIIRFPKLEFLDLAELYELECFYRGSYELQFPALKLLTLECLPRMRRFAGPENSKGFFSEKVEFLCLEELHIEGSMHVSYSNFFYSHPFQSLRVLKLESLEWKHVFSADAVASGCIEQLKQLKKLEIDSCSEMEVVVEVEVESFRGRQQEGEEEGNGGGLLGNGQEEVVKKAAEDGATSSSSSSLNLVFPQLKSIHLKSCHKMRSFFSAGHRHVIVDLPSLEKVDIDCCDNLEFFSYATIKAPKLAPVQVKKSKSPRQRQRHR